MSEREILHAILGVVGAREDCRVWRNSVGAAKSRGGRFVQFGLPGSADILGIARGGRFIAIEVKSDRGQLSPEQRAFKAMVERFGGIYVVARCVEDAVRAVEGACA